MTAADRYARLKQQPFVSTTRAAGLGSTWSTVADIFRHREMLALMVRRDLKSRYKDSALGFVWTLVRPLTQLAIYYIVLGKFLGAERGIPEFAIYIYSGLIAYGLFSEIVGGSTASIVGNGGLIKKVYLPREVFPLATVGGALFNFVIQLGILIIATIAIGSFPWHVDLLYFIPSVLLLTVWGLAFGLLLAAVNVYLRDIGYLVEVLLLLLLWASPIVYAWQFVRNEVGDGILLDIYSNNPITLAVLGFHKAFWVAGSAAEYPAGLDWRLLIAICIGFVLLFAFQRVFARLQGNFAQEL